MVDLHAPARPLSQRVPARDCRRAARRLLVALGLCGGIIALRVLVAAPVTVSGGSMEPTLGDGDVVLVAPFRSSAPSVERGDLVVFRDPDDDRSLKRVVGLPGDSIAIRDAVLEVDGRAVAEPYVDHATVDGSYFGPVDVPAGAVFLLGDDRANSIDSRVYGAVGLKRLTGRVLVRVWPASGW